MVEDSEYQAVLAKLEDVYKQLQTALDRQDAEDKDHADIKRDLRSVVSDMQKNQDSIRVLSGDIKSVRDEVEHTVQPVASWLRDAHTVGRVMRIVRAIIGWLALVVGAVALVSIAAMDAIKAHWVWR